MAEESEKTEPEVTEEEVAVSPDGTGGEDASGLAKLMLVESFTNTPEDKMSSMTSLQPNLVVPLSMTEMYEVLMDLLGEDITRYAKWQKEHQEFMAKNVDNKEIVWGPKVTKEQEEAEQSRVGEVFKQLTEVFRMSLYKHRRSVGGIHRMATVDLAKEEMAMQQQETELKSPDDEW